jgi:endonuclease/exonuclease/phosphatase family metal-dependent hydrolase
MPTVRIASFNVEWMNDWFTEDAAPVAFRPTYFKDGHLNNTDQIASRVAAVIRAVDPDILAIQEGPSRAAELALFVQDYLSDAGVPRYQFFLGDSGAAQKLGLLYKPGAVSAQLAPHSSVANLIDPWMSDVDGDAILDEYQFTRVPLVVDLTVGGHTLQIIVMHTKSNFINNGAGLWANEATRQTYIVAALKNRRRISSEAMRTRRYLDAALRQDPALRVIVLGDLNDGPGLDYFEERYLTHNVTDILIGSAFAPELIFAHALHDVVVADRFTAIFDDFVTGEDDKHLLLDHLLLSPGLSQATGLRRIANSGSVHHAEYEAEVTSGGIHRDQRASDHRPVSVGLQF